MVRKLKNGGQGRQQTTMERYTYPKKRQSQDKENVTPNKKARSMLGSEEIAPQLQNLSLVKEETPSKVVTLRPSKPKPLAPVNAFLGWFSVLPPEMVFHVMDQLDVDGLTRLSVSSKMMRDLLLDYLFVVGRKRFAKDTAYIVLGPGRELKTRNAMFKDWGTLFKAATCVNNTKERIDFMNEVFTRLFNPATFSCLTPFEAEKRTDTYWNGWGLLFHSFIARWDFIECCKAYDSMLAYKSNLVGDRLKVIFDENYLYGSNTFSELWLRRFFRCFLLEHDFSDERDGPFWTNVVMSSTDSAESYCQVVKLLFIIYGPLTGTPAERMIDWTSLSEDAVVDKLDFDKRIAGFCKAMDNISSPDMPYRRKYSQDNLFAFIEELTTFPTPWCMDNFAAFLLKCQRCAVITIVSRILHDHMEEAAALLNSMKNVIVRCSLNPCCLHRIMSAVCANVPPAKIRQLLRLVLDGFVTKTHQIIETGEAQAANEFREEVLGFGHLGPILVMMQGH